MCHNLAKNQGQLRKYLEKKWSKMSYTVFGEQWSIDLFTGCLQLLTGAKITRVGSYGGNITPKIGLIGLVAQTAAVLKIQEPTYACTAHHKCMAIFNS